MKKIIVILSLIILAGVITNTTEDLVIPNEAIRIRVIANSNSPQDQLLKKKVREDVEKGLSVIMEDVTTVEEAREKIRNSLKLIDVSVEQTIKSNSSKETYKVEYGNNYFPEKKYKGVVYNEGYYESIVITIGEGKGDNWWCVLFPPLCLMEADSSDIGEVEYKSFFKEIIDKYFKN